MLNNRCIFFFFYIFPHWKVDIDSETRWLADLLIDEFASRSQSEFFWVFMEGWR